MRMFARVQYCTVISTKVDIPPAYGWQSTFHPHFRDHLGVFLPLVWPRRRRLTELLTHLIHGSFRAAVKFTCEHAQSGPPPTASVDVVSKGKLSAKRICVEA
jgi:hypothetical protein